MVVEDLLCKGAPVRARLGDSTIWLSEDTKSSTINPPGKLKNQAPAPVFGMLVSCFFFSPSVSLSDFPSCPTFPGPKACLGRAS